MEVQMKRLLVVLLCMGGVNLASAEECEPAVDAAESLNVNASDDCDYKDTGLNGAVHRWFKREISSSSASSSQSVAGNTRASIKMSPPVKDAESLATARYTLLSAISQECMHGFRITDELFLPVEDKLTIRLLYECL